jgi:hypothetical protein
VKPEDGWLYDTLVLAHVTCAVGGFGAVVYRGLVLDLARRRGRAGAAEAGALAVYGQVSGFAEVLVYGVAVFGLAALGAAGDPSVWAKPWVIAALAVYVVMVGALHALVRPAERDYRRTLLELAELPPLKPPARPPHFARLDNLYRRVAAGVGVVNLCLLGQLYLMVFKP